MPKRKESSLLCEAGMELIHAERRRRGSQAYTLSPQQV